MPASARALSRAQRRGRRRPARCRTARGRRVRCLEGALAALGPAQRQLHRALDLVARRRQLEAFVELHGDVGAEQRLDLDRAFGRQLDHRAVEMRAEGDAALVDLAQTRTSDITWKPPESVRIGIGQFMNLCRPPSAAMRSAPGRSIR